MHLSVLTDLLLFFSQKGQPFLKFSPAGIFLQSLRKFYKGYNDNHL